MKPFRIYKLRTMVRDAEAATAGRCSPRRTTRASRRVGRFLRRFRIDEIPQLVNILKGEMSFVGPRPERPFFVEQYLAETPGYRERFNIKPGVTGLAQVSGGYATTPERKLKYDLIYMYHQTPGHGRADRGRDPARGAHRARSQVEGAALGEGQQEPASRAASGGPQAGRPRAGVAQQPARRGERAGQRRRRPAAGTQAHGAERRARPAPVAAGRPPSP